MQSLEQLQAVKQEWLYSHIDVPYPTAESLAGWKTYKGLERQCASGTRSSDGNLEWHWVTFHKLTVWFAQYYARQLSSEKSVQNELIEFLTQITIDPDDPIKLYLIADSSNATVVAAGFCHVEGEETTLIEHLGDVSESTALELLQASTS